MPGWLTMFRYSIFSFTKRQSDDVIKYIIIQGDSGGPLIVTKRGNQCKFYVIGITSFGKSCGQANTAAIYSKVSVFVPWIEENIW